MDNLMTRSTLETLADKIESSRFANSLSNFVDDLEGPVRESLSRLIDTGIDTLRSKLGVSRRRSLLGRTLMIGAALGALSFIAYKGMQNQKTSSETLH